MIWAFAREAGCRPSVALGGAILAAVPGRASRRSWPSPTTSPSSRSSSWPRCGSGARGLRGDARAFAATGVLVGLATLARNDGVLVGAALAPRLALVAPARPAGQAGRERDAPPALPVWAAVVAAVLFLAVMAPWEARQLAVFGSLSPSSSTGRILFIRSIDELNSITGTPTLGYLPRPGDRAADRQPADRLLRGDRDLQRPGRRDHPRPVHGRSGPGCAATRRTSCRSCSTRRSSSPSPASSRPSTCRTGRSSTPGAALAPQAYLLALEAVVALVAWIARHRPSWNAESAGRVFVGGIDRDHASLGAVYFTANVHETWGHERDLDQAVGAALGAQRRGAR